MCVNVAPNNSKSIFRRHYSKVILSPRRCRGRNFCLKKVKILKTNVEGLKSAISTEVIEYAVSTPFPNQICSRKYANRSPVQMKSDLQNPTKGTDKLNGYPIPEDPKSFKSRSTSSGLGRAKEASVKTCMRSSKANSVSPDKTCELTEKKWSQTQDRATSESRSSWSNSWRNAGSQRGALTYRDYSQCLDKS